jgi:hypothetical protein
MQRTFIHTSAYTCVHNSNLRSRCSCRAGTVGAGAGCRRSRWARRSWLGDPLTSLYSVVACSLYPCTFLCCFALSVVSLLALPVLFVYWCCSLSCCWRPALSVPALGRFQMVTAGSCESGVAACRGAALSCFSRENAQWVAGGCWLVLWGSFLGLSVVCAVQGDTAFTKAGKNGDEALLNQLIALDANVCAKDVIYCVLCLCLSSI